MPRSFSLVAALINAGLVHAQEQADPRTLIPSATLNAIAPRVSGAQAHNHVLVTRFFRELEKSGAYAIAEKK